MRLGLVFIKRYKILLILGFLIGFSSFIFLPYLKPLLPKMKKTETIGIVGRFKASEIPLEIQSLISYGLTKSTPEGKISEGIAYEWKIEDDGKLYIFFLKDDLFWHDGTKVKASDINYNFKDVSLETSGSQVIKFHLKEPFSPFLEVVSQPIFKKGLIGLGPYKVKRIKYSGPYVEMISLTTKDISKPNLKFRFYPTEEAAKIGFKLGEIQKIKDLSSANEFLNWKNTKISPVLHKNRFVGIFLNTQNPYLAKKNFRQALAYAIPKDEYKEKRALGPISPLSWAYNENVKSYDFNLENAKSLLNKALEGKKEEITFRFLTTPFLLSEAEKIKQFWEKIGIKTEIESFDPEKEFDILLAIQEIPNDPDQYSLWHSTQMGNITHLKNPRIDKLLEDGRKTTNQEERKKIYFDFQRFLAEEVPVIFLYHPISYDISRK